MLAQKVSDKQAKLVRPLVTRIRNLITNGVDVQVRSQLNLNMIRGYKCDIELERYGRRMQITVDRDELMMMSNIAMRSKKDITVAAFNMGAKLFLRGTHDNLLMMTQDVRGTLRAVVNPLELENALKAE